ncbi:cytochrome P450 [Micromonospora kangleipakensis]|uniref:Cytochrome P450 n=1 Tax=Micromonospora kangleipakensis TaxID=1077942 RepID=A0A4Q8BGJ5_9ACTN|nr:cytochrome P450 [Micromonospora kangleipakensis]RZU76433.1 cytochrome P450 [Micromonospora kangleipakensis]
MSWSTIAATAPCGPPVPDVEGGWSVTLHADVTAVLTHPDCVVPTAPGGPPGTLAWLRGAVSRFSDREHHPARRAVGVAVLAKLDPDELRTAAGRLTEDEIDRAGGRLDVMARLARRVPLEVLAARLGLADPTAAVPAVAAVAAAYHPGATPAAVARADRAVGTLLAMSPPASPEVTANRLGLLVQACDATAGLIGAAARHVLPAPASVSTGDLLAEVLRLDPPVRATRRVATVALRLGGWEIDAGAALLLRFDAANRDPAVFAEPDRFAPGRPGRALTFGAGPRGCPGERHALALAAGVVDVLRRRCRATDAEIRHDPHPTLRVPTRLEVIPR